MQPSIVRSSCVPRIALIAGQGSLPSSIITQRKAENLFTAVICIQGQTPLELSTFEDISTPFIWVKFGMVQPVLDFLKKHNIWELTMAGGVQKPRLQDLSLDWKGTRWLSILGSKFFKGDDHLLSGIVELLEKEQGINVLPAHSLLDDLFLPQTGNYTAVECSSHDLKDIQRGIDLITFLSSCDVGQAVAVCEGNILGIECMEGTQGLIERLRDLPFYNIDRNLSEATSFGEVKKGFVVKMAKKNQSVKVDMPTIGVNTIQQVADSPLKGIAVQISSVQVLDKNEVIKTAQKLGVCLYGFEC